MSSLGPVLRRHGAWLGIGVAMLLVAATRCAAPDRSGAPPRPFSLRAFRFTAPLAPHRAAAVSDAAQLPHAVRGASWMADIHTAVMQDLLARRGEIHALDVNGRCRAVLGLVRKQLPAIIAHTGISDGAFYATQLAHAAERGGCPRASALAIWTPGPALLAQAASGDTLVTGAFLDYSADMESVMLNANGPADVASGMDAILARASLGAPDLAALTGIAEIAVSSAYYWDAAYQPTSGGGSGSVAEPMAIFAWGPTLRALGWSDLVGAVGGAAAVIYTSGGTAAVVPQAVFAGAVIGGAFGSAAYVAAM